MPIKTKKTHPNNPWKKRFTILILVNIIVLVLFGMYIYSPIPKTEIEQSSNQYKSKNSSEFVVRTTPQNVNDLVNAYIDKLQVNSDYQYTIKMDEDLQLYGELPVFSSTVPLLIDFDPEVQDNGDLALKVTSISVADLKLPSKKIMQYVKKYLSVPSWVVIQPDKQQVYVNVTEMDIKSNLEVEVQQFDLENNNLAFKIRIPYQTLGIDPNLQEQLEQGEGDSAD